ncbi:cytidine deaminase [Pelagibacterium halotolerans B2]|uniref:Cytidine deaminase n=1 Tax=Pelagibacterium halotolerans (strain DSM 22347 / JCM 15775 / CGMCC 1.7692 / B2) TaxID=1082931 RepID=G4RFQ7_PELHB|nr:cytidine deaminase [Pelagibacterium halotolerans]AEQ50071.1 cytidine deaminase [Pelagibacterium halotolerans B2]
MATLSPEDKALFTAAETVRARAYAPYSGFHVGAAILADDGKIYSGCNVENAAYPVGNCAEPSAIAAMLAGGGKRIEKIFVTGPGTTPVTPCGGGRPRSSASGSKENRSIRRWVNSCRTLSARSFWAASSGHRMGRSTGANAKTIRH